MVWLGAASAALSIMGNLDNNKQLQIQQNALVKGMEAYNVAKEDQMKDINRQVGTVLSNEERKELRQLAIHTAQRAESGTAGNSALYAYTNFMTQKAIQKGNVVAKGEAALRAESKEAQAKRNQVQSGINKAQSQKKSPFTIMLEGASAFAQGYATGVSMTPGAPTPTPFSHNI